jgi:hypothetical protein
MQNKPAPATARNDQPQEGQLPVARSQEGRSPVKQPQKGQPPDPVSSAAPKASARAQLTDGPRPSAAPEGAVDEQIAAALMELDLEGAQRRSRRVGPDKKINVPVQLKDHAEAERANRATLDEIAASLGVSRSAMNRILDEPKAHLGGKHPEKKSGNKRHTHGTGRRRHAG